MDVIKTALVGAGKFGDTHARTYFENEGTKLVCICDINEELAKKQAEKYKCSYTTRSSEVVSDDSIEIVSIALPDHAHRAVSIEMIEHGKNVLIEKPLATTVEDAEAITSAARAKGVRMMCDFQNRWNPPFIAAKQRIESGSIGKPVSAYARLANSILIKEWLTWAAQSGPQWFLAPHIIDLVCWLFDQKAVKVYANARREVLKKDGFDTYDAIQAQIVFEDAFATIDVSWIVPSSWPNLDFCMDMQSTKGKLRIEPTCNGIGIGSPDGYQEPFIAGRLDYFNHMFGFFREPILHFVDCVRNDKPCIVDIDDGLINTKIIVAIEKSIETKQIIDIE